MKDLFLTLINDEEGQGMTEYIIIVCLIAMFCFLVIQVFGTSLKALFRSADTQTITADDNWAA